MRIAVLADSRRALRRAKRDARVVEKVGGGDEAATIAQAFELADAEKRNPTAALAAAPQ
jgi:hypothetical protein